MSIHKIKKSGIQKKYISRHFFTHIFIHSLLGILMVALVSFLLVSLRASGSDKIYAKKSLCQNGGIQFSGLCWLPIPQADVYSQQAKVCAESNLKIASQEQLASSSFTLMLMGILPLQETLWTSNHRRCGMQDCRVILNWQKENPPTPQENLMPEQTQANFKAICVGEALPEKSKKIHVFVPVTDFKGYN